MIPAQVMLKTFDELEKGDYVLCGYSCLKILSTGSGQQPGDIFDEPWFTVSDGTLHCVMNDSSRKMWVTFKI